MWRVLAKMELPYLDPVEDAEGAVVSSGRVKEPGDTITKQEMEDAKQSPDDIASLEERGVIEEET